MPHGSGMATATDGRLLVTSNETPAATSAFNGGIAFRASDFAMFYFDLVLTPVPATAVFHDGLAYSPQGALYCTTNTAGTQTSANGETKRVDGALLVVAASPTLGTDQANGGLYYKASNGATFIQIL